MRLQEKPVLGHIRIKIEREEKNPSNQYDSNPWLRDPRCKLRHYAATTAQANKSYRAQPEPVSWKDERETAFVFSILPFYRSFSFSRHFSDTAKKQKNLKYILR